MEKYIGVCTWDTNSHALFMHSISQYMKCHSVGLSWSHFTHKEIESHKDYIIFL